MNPESSEAPMPRKKTSIYVDEDLWKEFTIWVVTNRGNRRLSDTIEEALQEFMKRKKAGS